MSATASILDADMATIGRKLGTGYAWWRQELAALVPAGWRRRAQASLLAHYSPAGEFSFSRRGRAVERTEAERARAAPVAIALPESMCLVRPLEYPAVAEGDLRRMVLLDADRLLPFTAGSAYVDVALDERDPETGRQRLLLAGLPKQRALDVMAAAESARLDPRALGVQAADARHPLRFDFLPLIKADADAAGDRSAARFWWIALGIFFTLNLLGLVLRDVQSVSTLRSLVAEQGQVAGAARQIAQRVAREDARRALILDRRETRNPLVILAIATDALPDGAWVQRYAWNGATLRLTGFKQGDVDILAALRREPVFHNVRAATSDIPAALGSGQPFDVAMEIARAETPPGLAR